MPELPEVETVLQALLQEGIMNSPILKVEIKKNYHIKEILPAEFVNKLIGQNIRGIERKGKQLVFLLDK
jgi:formamidopyrimidine-DNA glycosylase